MKYSLSSQCKKQIDKIKQKDGFLYKKIKKQLKIFAQDPQHSSLRLHKLSGSQSDTWSISINRSIRMLFVYQDIKSGKMKRV
ncbi:hypothetical protein KKD03_03475 [Patescibacteria group bacterium]|nr:hypothetical protein [Patescibacteria group bacterium]